jgi:hypothetical protein
MWTRMDARVSTSDAIGFIVAKEKAAFAAEQ